MTIKLNVFVVFWVLQYCYITLWWWSQVCPVRLLWDLDDPHGLGISRLCTESCAVPKSPGEETMRGEVPWNFSYLLRAKGTGIPTSAIHPTMVMTQRRSRAWNICDENTWQKEGRWSCKPRGAGFGLTGKIVPNMFGRTRQEEIALAVAKE